MGGLVGFGWTICSPSKVLPIRELMGRLRYGRARYPLLHVLLQIVDVLPSQTATVERGFSLLNRRKDKKRVALEEDSLQELMAVCSNGASLLKRVVTCRGWQGHHSLEPGRSLKTSFARTCSWQWKKGRHGGCFNP